jgi:hypothetical protein
MTLKHMSMTQKNAIFDPKKDILTLIAGNPFMTYTEIALPINRGPGTVKRYCKQLKKAG